MIYTNRHGGPYDRGRSDSYYGRSPRPHYYVEASIPRVEILDLTKEELNAYRAGYDQNESDGCHKDWR
jgi:hypothetical protein